MSILKGAKGLLIMLNPKHRKGLKKLAKDWGCTEVAAVRRLIDEEMAR